MSSAESEIIMLNNLAERARQVGDKERAAELFQLTFQLIARHGATARTEASACTNFGLLLLSLDKYEEADKVQRRALDLDLKRQASPADLGYSYHNLGFTLTKMGKAEEGLGYLKKARDLRSALGDHKELATTLEALGEASLVLERLDDAQQFAEDGLALGKVLGRTPTLRGVLTVLAAVAERRSDYARAVQLHDEILSLLEELRNTHKDYERLDLFDARYNRRYLEAIELFLKADHFPAALAVIDRTRFRSGCDLLEGVRRFDSPLAAHAVTLPKLRDDELILVEWIYPEFDWSFPISARNPELKARRIVTSDKKGPPEKLDIDTEWEVHFANTLRQTQLVIDAYETELSRVSRVVVMPHGTQWQTPFAALTHPRTRKRLQDTHELLVSPSLRYCAITDSRHRITSRKRLVIGDPTKDLPGARKEAQIVARILGGELLLGDEAKREAVRQALNGAELDVLHYAGHGVYTATGLSALMLADGMLAAEDVGSLKFKANLVNLASCWGGMATFSVWNELYGFVRALLCAGTRNVISSVYPLDDEILMTFSKRFYEGYSSSEAHPSTSFRAALKVIPQHASVSGWGGLFVTGQR